MKYKDRIKFKSGFYVGLEGDLIEYEETTQLYDLITVKLDDGNIITTKTYDLE